MPKSILKISEVDGDRIDSCFIIELETIGTVTLTSDDPLYYATGAERNKALKEARECARTISKALGLKITEDLFK